MSTQTNKIQNKIRNMAMRDMDTRYRNLKKKRWFLAKGQGRENQDMLIVVSVCYGLSKWEETGY